MSQTETHRFQAETQQLLDLMIHSLYTHKDVFLRELISNASDALDKRRFEAVQDPSLAAEGDAGIELIADPDARTLEVRDEGIGMSRDELVENLGTIARSGTREFLVRAREVGGAELPADLIGQFGVGFYSSFIVADKVTVTTRRVGESGATRWESSGDGSYTLSEAERDRPGTSVLLHLRPVDEDDGLRDYADRMILAELVRRYSDFVTWPIRYGPANGEVESEPLNSRKAIWMRDPAEVKDEEYDEFYRHVSHDWADPAERIALHIEGTFEARALLYLPSQAPWDLYQAEHVQRGVQLYVKRVFVMDDCRALVPTWLRFLRGVVDAEDLSLNVSREMLQEDRQIRAIRKRITRRVLGALEEMRDERRDDYTRLWQELGAVLKEGLLDRDADQQRILGLMLADSTHDAEQRTTLAEYIERLPEDRKEIYFLSGATRESLERSPHLEAFRARGIEVLLFTDRVDEVWLQSPPDFGEHRFVPIGRGDVELGSEDERKAAREALEARESEHRELLARLRAILQEEVSEVRFSRRLTESAACLVGDEHTLSPALEEMLRRSGQEVPKARRILELNPDHALVTRLQGLFEADPAGPALERHARLLHASALLSEGGRLAEPDAFARDLTQVMLDALGDAAADPDS